MPNKTTNQRKIQISELPKEIPDFYSSYESKDSIIKKWIINWIRNAIQKNSIKENDILPNKSEISEYLGVSVGTVQNAIRYVEDEGYLKSKQRLGTMISNHTNPISALKKSTSKREKTINAIKNILIKEKYKIGKPIPSTRKMSEILQISQNTVRLAYENLVTSGIIESKQIRGIDSNWILKKEPVLESCSNDDILSSSTLVDIITEDIKLYLSKSFNIGDRIPSHEFFAKEMKVSIKTIHDCISSLSDKGILISRRGRYGTILAQDPLKPLLNDDISNEIFLSSEEASTYFYQKIENQLGELIRTEYKAGDKLPSMVELSKKFNVSTNTIRRALNSFAEEGYITFSRGRFGGTYVVDTPEPVKEEAYQWLAINPDFI